MTARISIRGIIYPSQRAAAAALGVTPSAINAAKVAGTLEYVGLGHRRGKGNDKPFQFGGIIYPSQRAAAAAIGIADWQLSGYLATLAAMRRAGV